MNKLVAREGMVLLPVLLLASVVLLSGCSPKAQAGPTASFSRSYGATDPCQFTTLQLKPKQGVDLSVAGQKLVDGFEGFTAIGDVNLYAGDSKLDVTWCTEMQTEQGIVRAVGLSNLVTIESVSTQPNTRK